MVEIGPISEMRQNFPNENHIRTAISDKNLHHRTKFVTRLGQEEVIAPS